MDSLSSSDVKTSLDILLQIAKIYPTAKSTLQINRLSVQQQVAIHDCGMFAIAYAVETCHRNDVQKSLFDQKSMRKHLHDYFNNAAVKITICALFSSARWKDLECIAVAKCQRSLM